MPLRPELIGRRILPQPGGISPTQFLGLGQQLGTRFRQQKEQEQIADIFSRNIQTTPGGDEQLNRPGVLSDLYQTRHDLAFKYEQGWAQDDARIAAQEAKIAAQTAKQFAPTKLQKFVGLKGFMRSYDPSTGKVTYATDEQGQKVAATDVIRYIETPEGYVAVSTKRAPTTAPELVPGITPAGRRKRQLAEKKTELDIKKTDLAIVKAVKDAAMGGQFKSSQYEASGYGIRMQETEVIMSDLTSEGFDATKITYAMLTRGPEYFKPGPLKRYIQAKKSFINATLRRESGAAIAQSEFDNAEEQYFPQVGDTPEVLAQKKRNREVVQAMMKAEAGGAWGETASALEGIRGVKKPKTPSEEPIITPSGYKIRIKK